MTPDDDLKQIEAELAHPDRAWQYQVGGFATKYFLAGYVLSKNGVASALQVLEGECEIYPYPAVSLLYRVINEGYGDKEYGQANNERAFKIGDLERLIRGREMIRIDEQLSDIATDHMTGVFSEWYMMCGFVLGSSAPISLMKFANMTTATILELVTMLYAFAYILKNEEGLKLSATTDDIIQMYNAILNNWQNGAMDIKCPICFNSLQAVYDDVDIGVGSQRFLAFYECQSCGQLPICYGCHVVEAGNWKHETWCEANEQN